MADTNGCDPGPARLAQPRSAPVGRRLRDRLLVADVPEAIPGRGDQDRPLVRERARPRGGRHLDRRGGGAARALARAERGRRGCRDAAAAAAGCANCAATGRRATCSVARVPRASPSRNAGPRHASDSSELSRRCQAPTRQLGQEPSLRARRMRVVGDGLERGDAEFDEVVDAEVGTSEGDEPLADGAHAGAVGRLVAHRRRTGAAWR